MGEHDSLAKEHANRYERLQTDRAVLDSHLQEIRDYILPLAQSFTGTDVKGAKNRQQIFDNSGESSAELLHSTLHGELANPAERWFQLQAEDKALNRRGDVAAWLEDTEDRLFRIFNGPQSKWDTELGTWFPELTDFGTAVMAIVAEPGRGIRFNHYPLAETYLDQDADGTVDTLYRCRKLTARQAVAEWGKDAGEKVARKAGEQKTQDEEFRFLRCVYPASGADRAGRRFESVWINLEEKHVVRQRRFYDFPFMVARWARRGDEIYGRGPGMRALADVKMLQEGMRLTLRSAEKIVDPPLLAPDDGVIGPISLASAAINTYRADLLAGRRAPVEPLLSGGRPDLGEDLMNGIRLRIANAYYEHLLRLPREPRMPVAHVLALEEERIRTLGPVFGRVQYEGLGHGVDRTLQILLRLRITAPPPAELEGRRLIPTFQNPFAQARAVAEAAAVSRLGEIMSPMIDRDPTLMDNLDGDEAWRVVAAGLNAPMTVTRDPRVVARIRERRAQEAAELQKAELMANQAKAMQSASQAVVGLQGGAA